MDPRDLSDDQLDQLAQQLAGRLPTGTHGDRVVLSRRQFALAASGVLSAGALMALGVDEASAQAAGQVGTASDPVDVEAAALNANSVSTEKGTITADDKDIPGVPETSSAGAGFDSWTQVSSTRPAIVEIDAVAQTDGSSDGEIRLEVDESGGTNQDYYLFVVRSHNSEGAGVFSYGSSTVVLPAGAQYQISNISDPNSNNAINDIRQFVL